MARIRTIKPKFWDDIKVAKISRDARLTFIGMWNFCDDAGVIIGEPVWIKSKVFPFDQIQIQQFERWLAELNESGFISQFSYKKENFYYLPNFTKHQVINRPNYDELNVPKSFVEESFEASVPIHGTITEQSVQEGKGEEGKGKESDGAHAPPCKSFKQWTEKDFYAEVSKFKNDYAKDLLRAFYNHWSEKSPSGKMALQLKATWETSKRLATWQRIDESKKKPTQHIAVNPTNYLAQRKKDEEKLKEKIS